MTRMKRNVELIVGEKISESESQPSPDKIGSGQPVPTQDPEVVGRCVSHSYVICPTCNAINLVYIDDQVWTWYRCWNTRDGVHYFKV